MLGWFGFGAYVKKSSPANFIEEEELGLVRKMEKENKSVKKTACDVEVLKKCLEENKGDYLKCQSLVEAFRSSCSINNSNSSSTKLHSVVEDLK
ncbi:hypothetical protein R3W88_008810 [Solanum pinnatisectum]|uniref:Uncharacterized protein n=1 Tax=Solanum pinnatisectum TaxID=50273 RepID=A0AAV9MBT3_9SOLN|nr:hypothetical protein R3W88_008810 [Solanum pinnatisectum]